MAAAIVPPTCDHAFAPETVRSTLYETTAVAPAATGAAHVRTFCALPGETTNVVGAVGVVADDGVAKTIVTSDPDTGRAVAMAVFTFTVVNAVTAKVYVDWPAIAENDAVNNPPLFATSVQNAVDDGHVAVVAVVGRHVLWLALQRSTR